MAADHRVVDSLHSREKADLQDIRAYLVVGRDKASVVLPSVEPVVRMADILAAVHFAVVVVELASVLDMLDDSSSPVDHPMVVVQNREVVAWIHLVHSGLELLVGASSVLDGYVMVEAGSDDFVVGVGLMVVAEDASEALEERGGSVGTDEFD